MAHYDMDIDAQMSLNINIHWDKPKLLEMAEFWHSEMCEKYLAASENSPWWDFNRSWNKNIDKWLKDFCDGKHQFSPMKNYVFKDGMARTWFFLDRLIMHLIFKTLRPTFKHIISPLCRHLSGPTEIIKITNEIKEALSNNRFEYIMRIDIKSFYASIDHKILLKQINENLDDPKILKYLEDIVTVAIDDGGNVFLPTKGIPRQSALSPFFGALYLSDLDKAFTNRKGIHYCRYMDDIVILIETKRQYSKARRRLFAVLRKLRLSISPHKTRMGTLKKDFHFLGVNIEVSQNPQETQDVAVNVHPRTCRRALDKVIAMKNNAVHPAQIQR